LCYAYGHTYKLVKVVSKPEAILNIIFYYQIGSPTILADPAVEKDICLTSHPHGVYIPVGAMWGAHDIRKMADMGTLKVPYMHIH